MSQRLNYVQYTAVAYPMPAPDADELKAQTLDKHELTDPELNG